MVGAAQREAPGSAVGRLDASPERAEILKVLDQERVIPIDDHRHVGRGQKEIVRGVTGDEGGLALPNFGMERIRAGRSADDRDSFGGGGFARVVWNEEPNV